MQISVPLTNGLLPDQYGKFASAADVYANHPVRSFPITITDAPAGTKTFALTLVDFDSIPVAGFAWIHWIAANIPATMTTIADGASRQGQFVEGLNSNVSRFVGSTDGKLNTGYVGPQPPNGTHAYTLKVYALDTVLPLTADFYLNELRHAMTGHVLASVELELPNRSK